LLVFSLCFGLALPSAAQTPTHRRFQEMRQEQTRELEEESTLQRWREEIGAVEQLIREHRPQKALKKADKLAEDMLARIESGEGMGEWLGAVGLLRAVAAVDSGDRRLGVWHWHVAVQMFPELADRDLSVYGETGKFLAAHPARIAGGKPPAGGVPVRPVDFPGITAPVKKYAPAPEFPKGKRRTQGLSDAPVVVVVHAIIDKSGRVRDPLILRSEGELTMVLAALETMQKWEFEPAKINGEPVESYYNLTINFRLQR
jgi:TonB family protein